MGMLFVSGLAGAARMTENKQALPRWAIALAANTLPILFVAITHLFAPSVPYPRS
jgi:predicted membrane metal-binding protein